MWFVGCWILTVTSSSGLKSSEVVWESAQDGSSLQSVENQCQCKFSVCTSWNNIYGLFLYILFICSLLTFSKKENVHDLSEWKIWKSTTYFMRKATAILKLMVISDQSNLSRIVEFSFRHSVLYIFTWSMFAST